MDFIRLCKAGCLLGMWPLLAWADFNSILWDNADFLSPTKFDSYYTNGIVYHHVSDPVPRSEGREWKSCPGLGLLSRFLDPFLIADDEESQHRHSWEIGQIMETPLKKSLNPPDPLDQPYAGLLYAGCNYHVKTADAAETMGLQYGVVGPWSGAEETQEAAHRLVGKKIPQGWSHQLHNEPIINLRYDRQEILGRIATGSSGIIIHDNRDFALGPLLTSAAWGLNVLYAGNPEAAFGLNPNYLGRYPILSQSQPIGFYAQTGLQVTGVVRNLFLDGNTWQSSPSVHHERVVGAAQILFGYGFSCLGLQAGLNVTTRAFRNQAMEWPRYGVFTLSWGCSN